MGDVTANATAWTGRGPLSRPEIDQALAGPAPIVALIAPAGFGKTIALQVAASRSQGRAVMVDVGGCKLD